MRIVRRWVLGLLLFVLVVFGVCWSLMVRFEVESRFSQNFKMSPVIGNLFLIKSGQWGKVRQVKFVLTPEKQDLFLNYDRDGRLLSSVNVIQKGMSIEIIANYDQDLLNQTVNKKDGLNRDLLLCLCGSIENRSSRMGFCVNQVTSFLDWKNKYGLGEFVEFAKKRSLSLVKTAYAAGSCSGTVSCKAVSCMCSGTGVCGFYATPGDDCLEGSGICLCGCTGALGVTMQCSGLSNVSSCSNAASYDCAIGYCPVPLQTCTWTVCTGAWGSWGACKIGGGGLCVASRVCNCTPSGCACTCSGLDWKECTVTCDNYTSANCPTICDYPGGTLQGSRVGCGCGTINCPATDPCIPPSPPSCSVSGSTNVIVGDDVSYCVDPSDAPLGAEIWKSPQTSQSWTNVRPKTVGYGCNTTSFNQVGTYYVVCNAYGLEGSQCSGNPWCPWSPEALPEASCSDWVDCTANDVLVVNVISLGPWWQVKDGDVFTGGSISSDIPSTASNPFFNLEGLGGFPGIVNYNGSADFGSGSVSSIGWLVNSPFSIGNKYSTSYFENQIPADTVINTVSTNLFNNGVIDAGQAEDGIYWFKYDGSSGLDLSIDSDINVGSKKVVLIVNNVDLYINNKIDLTDGQGFFMVMVGKDSEGNRGNIYIDPSVYGLADDSAELKGLYLADGSFYTGEGDGQLHIKGSVVGLDGISLQRDLSDNSSNPAEFIEYDPNQIILFPKVLKIKKINWKEVAP